MPTFKEVKTVCDTVPGFMGDGELLALHVLAGQLPQHPQILEIGVYAGKSLIVWAMWAEEKQGRVHGLDIFEKTPFTPDCPDITTVERSLCSKITNFQLHKGNSFTLLDKFPVEYFDLVFIDGSHDYDVVKQDIMKSLPLLKTGGVLCGHDFHYPPIKKALDELLSGGYQDVAGEIWFRYK